MHHEKALTFVCHGGASLSMVIPHREVLREADASVAPITHTQSPHIPLFHMIIHLTIMLFLSETILFIQQVEIINLYASATEICLLWHAGEQVADADGEETDPTCMHEMVE